MDLNSKDHDTIDRPPKITEGHSIEISDSSTFNDLFERLRVQHGQDAQCGQS